MSSRDRAMRIANMGGEIANLKKENATLRLVAEEYLSVLVRANAGRDLYLGTYVGKDYRFAKADLKGKIERVRSAIEGSSS